MSGRLASNGLLYDYGQPLRKLAMDGAPPPAPAEVTLDTDQALRDLQRAELRRLIPHIDRLSNR